MSEAVVVFDLDQIDIVQPRPLQRLFVHAEAQWADQVQHRARAGAGSYDVSRILRDLRFYQNDMDRHFHTKKGRNAPLSFLSMQDRY